MGEGHSRLYDDEAVYRCGLLELDTGARKANVHSLGWPLNSLWKHPMSVTLP
jgi:hypothetical protein